MSQHTYGTLAQLKVVEGAVMVFISGDAFGFVPRRSQAVDGAR